jgi:hypothetical protein
VEEEKEPQKQEEHHAGVDEEYGRLRMYYKADFKRALLLGGVVGSILVMINQLTVILYGPITNLLYLRICLDYATPFTVSSITAILHNRSVIKKSLLTKRN